MRYEHRMKYYPLIAIIVCIVILGNAICIKQADRAYYRTRIEALQDQGTALDQKILALLKEELDLRKMELRILVERRIARAIMRITGKKNHQVHISLEEIQKWL